jgi:hypothetical protein
MRKMSEFDPTKGAIVHDGLNDQHFEWKPEYAVGWFDHITWHDTEVIAWDSLLLDGWRELSEAMPAPEQH